MSKSFFFASYSSDKNGLVPTKSYANRTNLLKALEGFGFTEAKGHRHFIMGTLGEDGQPDGRVTAIFPASNFSKGGYIGLYSQHGFLTLG